MANVVQFLEDVGSGAPIFEGSAGDDRYLMAVQALNVPDDLRHALRHRDLSMLGELVGGREKMMMQIWAPQEDEPQEKEVPVRETPDEKEDQQPEHDS